MPSGRSLESSEFSETATVAPVIENVQTPITELQREDVVKTVDAGLGSFLQSFQTEASLNQEGEFEGFRIVRIVDRERFRGLGIGAGDVVTSINGQSIERPMQAYAVFMSLKTAELLEIDYLRAGRKMRLSLPILGELPSASVEEAQVEPQKEASSAPQ